jgi:ABC-type glycerol-3-phosphate transport system substrate-binding protein
MRPLTILLVLAVLAFGAVGCGGGSNSTATTSTTTTEGTTTQETETTAATETSMTESTSTEASGFNFASGDCKKLLAAGQELSQSLSAAATDKQKLQESKQLFQSFVDKAPSEIKADLQILADAFSKYIDALGDINLKPGQTPDAATLQKLQQAIASVDQTKVQQASQHLDTWAKSHCGTTG